MYNKIAGTIQSTIVDYAKSSRLRNLWKEPIIEIISAQDEKLNTLKESVSSEHLMPFDILPDARSIISFFIPFQDEIVTSNIGGTRASKEWALAYIKTNDLIKTINNRIEALMEKSGNKAGKIPATHNFDTERLISNWSHRHIAHIAGMGTFGINNMLITRNGCCGRFGSIVISYGFENYTVKETKERCLHKINGSCGMCQKKCEMNAYKAGIFNRQRCYTKCLENAEYHKSLGYADVCGKCLAGLPCSTKDPSEKSA
jgi:epoxyqueuosine reductase QueG